MDLLPTGQTVAHPNTAQAGQSTHATDVEDQLLRFFFFSSSCLLTTNQSIQILLARENGVHDAVVHFWQRYREQRLHAMLGRSGSNDARSVAMWLTFIIWTCALPLSFIPAQCGAGADGQVPPDPAPHCDDSAAAAAGSEIRCIADRTVAASVERMT
jgi:hypothetical protein